MRWMPADRATIFVLEAAVHAVGDGAVVVEGGEAALDGVDQVVGALDVQVGLLLAGEGGVRQVLGGGGGTHRELQVFTGFRAHQAMVVADARFQSGRQRRFHHPAANLAAGLGQGDGVVDVQRLSLAAMRSASPLWTKFTEGIGRGGESAGDADPLVGQVVDHLPQGGILATDLVHIVHGQCFKARDIVHFILEIV
jgi:hypothetical protein